MSENNQTITSLHGLLDYDAGKFTSAEIHLKTTLHEWENIAFSMKLKTVLLRYIDYVQEHIQMMEGFFEEEKINALSINNRVMQAYIDEADEKIAICKDTAIKDACLLACIQAINHFKISMYGTAAAFANTLGMEKQAAIFHEAEVNEKQIDDRLSQLAEHEINVQAKVPGILEG